MTLQFVNYRGQPLHICKLDLHQKERKTRAVPDSFHKGWRVQGIPPGALQKARDRHLMLSAGGGASARPSRSASRNGCATRPKSQSAPSPTRFLTPRKPAQT